MTNCEVDYQDVVGCVFVYSVMVCSKTKYLSEALVVGLRPHHSNFHIALALI